MTTFWRLFWRPEFKTKWIFPFQWQWQVSNHIKQQKKSLKLFWLAQIKLVFIYLYLCICLPGEIFTLLAAYTIPQEMSFVSLAITLNALGNHSLTFCTQKILNFHDWTLQGSVATKETLFSWNFTSFLYHSFSWLFLLTQLCYILSSFFKKCLYWANNIWSLATFLLILT